MRNCQRGFCIGLLLGPGFVWAAGPAGVKTDGTLGGTPKVLSGPTYAITQDLGKLSGGNLFQSFQYFNVAAGETALFTTTSPGINNVISRVTGGFASDINGKISLQAASGTPNFYLINPSGVTFGPGGFVDVPAAFHVTTADYLKFPDGNLYVDASKVSSFSAAEPQAFGFLGRSRAPVNIINAALSAGPGGDGTAEFQVVAGDVTIDGAGGLSTIFSSTGRTAVTAVGATAADVPLSGQFSASDGTVKLMPGGAITSQAVGGTPGGPIQIDAGNLLIEGHAAADTGIISFQGKGAMGPITVNVGNEITIANGGEIASVTPSADNSGDIFIRAGSLSILARGSPAPTGILSDSLGSGVAGQIQLQLGSLLVDGLGSIFTGVSSSADNPFSTSPSGNITVLVSGEAKIVNGGSIQSSSISQGNAGDISFSAGRLTITGGGSNAVSSISSDTYFLGSAGRIALTLGDLTIDGASGLALVTSTTSGFGNAGQISVNVSGDTTLTNGGIISTETLGAGGAGVVTLSAGRVAIGGGPQISGITSQATQTSSGQTGAILVTADTLLIAPNGVLTIRDDAVVANPGSIAPGVIDVNVGSIRLIDGKISAASSGDIAASAIVIRYKDSLSLISSDAPVPLPSSITTSSVQGNGGPIAILGWGPLFIDHSNITTSVTGTTSGNGGDISISVPQIVLNTGSIQANTQAPDASGGTVSIDTQALVPSFQYVVIGGSSPLKFDPAATGSNVVQAAAPDGVNGTLNVSQPSLDIGNALLGLSAKPYSAVALGRSLCGFTKGSSLAVTGRGGLPSSAYDLLWVGLEESAPLAESSKSGRRVGGAIDVGDLTACR